MVTISLNKLSRKNMSVQTIYQETIKFAAQKHANQTIPGSQLPYIVHLSNVAMEIFTAF